jgi:hypothetical protein
LHRSVDCIDAIDFDRGLIIQRLATMSEAEGTTNWNWNWNLLPEENDNH